MISDRVLIEQIREGEENAAQAWEQLIKRYEGRLLAFVDRRLNDRSASEDVVQESFIGFLNSLATFDVNRELQTYLFTIASHKLTDHLRKIGRHPLKTVSDTPTGVLQQQLDHNPAASSVARSDERRTLENDAISRCLGNYLNGLKEKNDWTRIKVLEMLWVKGWANRDVARHLDVSEQQVANYRFAAVKKLREGIRASNLSEAVFPELHQTEDEPKE